VEISLLDQTNCDSLKKECNSQTWEITKTEAEKLLKRLHDEEKYIRNNYSGSGDSSNSTSKLSTDKNSHNCASWAKAILKETFGDTLKFDTYFSSIPSCLVGSGRKTENGA